jgi:N-acetylmuramoyl-L-alanine amidase
MAPRLAPPATTLPDWSPSQARSFADTWISLGRWSRESGYGALRQVGFGPAPAFELSTTSGVLVVRVHSLLASWNGLELHLGFEPEMINDHPFVHFLDLKKTVEPLLQGYAPPSETNRTVVIDPGHGGQNTGTISVTDGVYEKEYTLDWAFRLESLLATNGWRVFLTRTNDCDVSLSNRVALAEEHKADLFISLHFNSAAPSQEQTGLETYCLTPAGMPSTLTRGYEDDPALAFANNAYDAENLRLAVLLHRALLTVIRSDRGVRHARFLGVLRGQNRPAILIEGGYLSNPAESRRIADPAYREKLAEAVAGALTGVTETGSRIAGISPQIPESQPTAPASPISNSVPDKGQVQ